MTERRVAVFFYGSFMDRAVLARQGVVPDELTVARLPGFALRLQGLANLVPAADEIVYGLVAHLTHDEVSRLYAHLPGGGTAYAPEAVLVQTMAGDWRPALCYNAPPAPPAAPPPEYLAHLLTPAREHGFPAWYCQRLAALAT